jgi:hypothetical protein
MHFRPTRVFWEGPAEEALALLGRMPDKARWDTFCDAFEVGLRLSSRYFK